MIGINGPSISVIVCTYNRASLLNQALTSLANQTLPEREYEVVIVDNASEDNTNTVAEEWTANCSNFRYVHEARQGLSYARNRGVAEARAPIIAYIDDDAVAETEWLSALLRTYDTVHPEPAGVGGRIFLKWDSQRPAWIHDDLLNLLGYTDHGNQVQCVRHIPGGNMSFQTELVRRYGGFNVRLGRRGNLQLTAEESDLQLRMRQDGHMVYYQPRAVVWHQLGPVHERPEYLVRRSYAHGQTDALRYAVHGWPGRYTLFKLMVRQLIRRRRLLLRGWKGFWLSKSTPPSPEQYLVRCRLAQLLGYEQQMIQLLTGGPPSFLRRTAPSPGV